MQLRQTNLWELSLKPNSLWFDQSKHVSNLPGAPFCLLLLGTVLCDVWGHKQTAEPWVEREGLAIVVPTHIYRDPALFGRTCAKKTIPFGVRSQFSLKKSILQTSTRKIPSHNLTHKRLFSQKKKIISCHSVFFVCEITPSLWDLIPRGIIMCEGYQGHPPNNSKHGPRCEFSFDAFVD